MTAAPNTPPSSSASRPATSPARAAPASGGSMARNTALLFAGTLASRVLGMLRETLIAATFDRAATDAFFIAWRVPNALRAMLAEGASRYILNPIFGDALHRRPDGTAESDLAAGKARMRGAVASLRGAALVLLTLVSLAGMLFARPIMALMSGGFGGDAARFELGTNLLRVLFPYIFFMGWFAIGNSALQLLDDFRPGAFAPVMLNVAFLVGPFVLAAPLARAGVPPIYALAVAALAGGVLQIAWLRPALGRQGLRVRPRFALDAHVREAGRQFLPQLFGQAVYQLNVIIAGRFLSGLPVGAASYFSYGQRLADIPQGLFTVALSGAAAAALQRDATNQNYENVARTYERSLRMAAFIALPMSLLLGVYAEAIVPLVFGYGRFRQLGATGTLEVASSLRWQALSVAFMAFVHQSTAVLGALKLRKLVVWVAAAAMVTFLVVGALATPRLGHVGVALALAASSFVQLALSLAAVRSVVAPVRFAAVGPSLAKVLFATGVAALAARCAVEFLPVTGFTLTNRLLALVCGALVVGVYLLAAWVLRCDEMTDLQDRLRQRAARRRQAPAPPTRQPPDGPPDGPPAR